jgi:signal peptidase I
MEVPPGNGPVVVQRRVETFTDEVIHDGQVVSSATTVVLEEVQEVFVSAGNARPLSPIGAILMDRARSLLGVLVASLFVLTFILQPFRIPSESMERTLLVGDFLLVNKSVFGPAGHWGWLLPYRQPRQGDIVVFRFPLDGEDHVVKRVIGVGGDRIHLRNGVVYRNSEALVEPYTQQPATLWPHSDGVDPYRDNFPNASFNDPGVDAHWWAQLQRISIQGDVVVPSGDYFVMGDNRKDSRDSRYWGFVPRENVVGMPILVYFSVREPSRNDRYPVPAPVQDDRLGNSAVGRLFGFARWDRILRVVR